MGIVAVSVKGNSSNSNHRKSSKSSQGVLQLPSLSVSLPVSLCRQPLLRTNCDTLTESSSHLPNCGGCQLDKGEWTKEFGENSGFHAYDVDGDGNISKKEYEFAVKTEKEMKELDADGDGKITKEEWIAKYGSLEGFDQYDLDGDGALRCAALFCSPRSLSLQSCALLRSLSLRCSVVYV